MGWGTKYKYNGYLSRIHKSRIFDEKEEIETRLDMYWQQILAYMAATPAEWAEYDDGEGKYPYPEKIVSIFRDLKKDMIEDYELLHRINDCIEAMEEDENNIKED